VSTRVVGIGGAGDMRPKVEPTSDTPRLEIEGIAIFGGFGVTATVSEEAAAALADAVARTRKDERPETDSPGVAVMGAVSEPEPTPAS
jgi:hypothetical protein